MHSEAILIKLFAKVCAIAQVCSLPSNPFCGVRWRKTFQGSMLGWHDTFLMLQVGQSPTWPRRAFALQGFCRSKKAAAKPVFPRLLRSIFRQRFAAAKGCCGSKKAVGFACFPQAFCGSKKAVGKWFIITY